MIFSCISVLLPPQSANILIKLVFVASVQLERFPVFQDQLCPHIKIRLNAGNKKHIDAHGFADPDHPLSVKGIQKLLQTVINFSPCSFFPMIAVMDSK